jgi:hypothetical protein
MVHILAKVILKKSKKKKKIMHTGDKESLDQSG